MDIKNDFRERGGAWVAEGITVNHDFRLYIKQKGGNGVVSIRQKVEAGEEYAHAWNGTKTVMNEDFSFGSYPRTIEITCGGEVVAATITETE